MRLSGIWFRKALAGFLIGIGCILPGVSGGVMAMSFGLYRPMLDAVLNFFRHPRDSVRFLFPLAVGGGLGLLIGAKGLAAAMSRYESLTLFLFIGFLVGGAPELWREARGNKRLPPLAWLFLGLVLALPLALMDAREPLVRLSALRALAAGLMEGIGTVIPGVSTSFVLIRLGWYQAYLEHLSALALDRLGLIALGFCVSALACMRGMQWLFEHAPRPVHTAALGFLLMSVALVFPGFGQGSLFWADCALVVIGIVCVRFLSSLDMQKE